MRRYETIFIADSELSEEGRKPILDRMDDLMQQHEGFLIKTDEWGTKRLAYDIKKKSRGYYIRLDYCGHGTLVNEIERFFRIDDRILKYMTVLLDKDADLDQIKEEMALAKAEEEKAAQEKAEKAAADQAARDEAEKKAAAEKAAESQDEETTPDAEATPEPAATPEETPEEAPEAEPSGSDKEEI